jgi:phosphoglycerate dehydrogenase-like enzyme
MSARIIFIGAPEADASAFEARARDDFPGIALFATNDRSEALRQLATAEALVGHHFQFDEAMLAAAPRLRWIQSLTTGTDAILKLRALRRDVTVTSTRGMHGPQMSELVFLQMLALARDFPQMQRNQTAHLWKRWPQPLLWGKTIVIVGVGAIAEVLAPRCKAFGMTVYGVSASPRLPTGFDKVFARTQLHECAALADFLVLIVPHSSQTENLVDASVPTAVDLNGPGHVVQGKRVMGGYRLQADTAAERGNDPGGGPNRAHRGHLPGSWCGAVKSMSSKVESPFLTRSPSVQRS